MLRRIIIGVFFLSILSSMVCATALTSLDTGIEFPLTFRPGFSMSIPMMVTGYSNIGPNVSLTIEGDLGEKHVLLQYFSIENVVNDGSGKTTFDVVISLPDDFAEPGMYYTALRASPKPPEGVEGIFGITAVRRMFVVKVLLQEPAISAKVKADDVNVGEVVNFEVPVKSETYADISKVWADINIIDQTGEVVKSIKTGSFELDSDEGKVLIADLDTSGIPPATYTASAKVHYDNQHIVVNDTFRIGTLVVDILNHTQEVYKDELNPFIIGVQNGWNDPVMNVYAEVEVEDGVPFRTKTEDLGPFEVVNLEGVLDGKGLDLGERGIKISVFYEGNERSKEGSIVVTESPRVIAQLEQTRRLVLSIGLPAGGVVLVLIVVIILLLRKQVNIKRPKKKRRR